MLYHFPFVAVDIFRYDILLSLLVNWVLLSYFVDCFILLFIFQCKQTPIMEDLILKLDGK